jgi:hypothetical protein
LSGSQISAIPFTVILCTPICPSCQIFKRRTPASQLLDYAGATSSPQAATSPDRKLETTGTTTASEKATEKTLEKTAARTAARTAASTRTTASTRTIASARTTASAELSQNSILPFLIVPRRHIARLEIGSFQLFEFIFEIIHAYHLRFFMNRVPYHKQELARRTERK